MPDVELAAREQDAVLWPWLRSDGHGGPVVDVPVALTASEGHGVKWDWTNSEVLSPDNATVKVDAKVVVDRTVAVGSLMWLGRLQDLAGTAGPLDETVSGLCQVVGYYHARSLKNRTARMTLGLARWRGKLPQGIG